MKRILVTAWLIATTFALGGCVPVEPHRYRLAVADASCGADAAQTPVCRNSILERTSQYDLHFVEFDDQGLQYPDTFQPAAWQLAPADVVDNCDLNATDCLHRKAWAYQINNLIKGLDATATRQPIVLLVFIHGWKHDARADDTNLQAFRQLLTETALIEQNRPAFERAAGGRPRNEARRVVGLYVGWRGESIDVPGLDNITFWTRKTSAMHVAEGSSRELFARLRGFKCARNAKASADGRRDCNGPPARDDAVKVILIGHSFGGLILYNAISGSLIETMTHAFDTGDDPKQPYWRLADLAVLINPAFEATRYAPLQRIAASTRYPRYEPPLLVTVTSTTDTATSFWFKLGRSVNTLFEQHADDEEKAANRETVGHHVPYLTHRLELPATGRVECPGWEALDPRMTQADQVARLGRDVAIEYDNSRTFFRAGRDATTDVYRMRPDIPWVRNFCGGARLSVTGTDPNSPIWNVSAISDPDLLPNHSDIHQPLFVAVFRQLYMDTIFLDNMVNGSPATIPR